MSPWPIDRLHGAWKIDLQFSLSKLIDFWPELQAGPEAWHPGHAAASEAAQPVLAPVAAPSLGGQWPARRTRATRATRAPVSRKFVAMQLSRAASARSRTPAAAASRCHFVSAAAGRPLNQPRGGNEMPVSTQATPPHLDLQGCF